MKVEGFQEAPVCGFGFLYLYILPVCNNEHASQHIQMQRMFLHNTLPMELGKKIGEEHKTQKTCSIDNSKPQKIMKPAKK